MKILFILLIILLIISAVVYRLGLNPYISQEGKPITVKEFALSVDSYRQRHPRMPNWLVAYILGIRKAELDAALLAAARIKEEYKNALVADIIKEGYKNEDDV